MAPAQWRKISMAEKDSVDWTNEVALQVETGESEEEEKNKVLFVLPRKSAMMAEFLKGMIEAIFPEAGAEAIVPLRGNKNMDVATMAAVVEFMAHYNGEQPPELEKPLSRHLRDVLAGSQPWARDYVYTRLLENGDEAKHSQLMKTAEAANFLQLAPLCELCCAAIASMFRDRNEQQICELFGVTQQFTEEERQRIEEEYPWLVAE